MRICRFRKNIARGSIYDPVILMRAQRAEDLAFPARTGLERARVSEPNRNGRAASGVEIVTHMSSPLVTTERQSKSFDAGRLSVKMQSESTLSAVSCRGLYTPLATLSTQVVARMHVRDLVFVSRASTDSYITTGVETRTPIECRPTTERPVTETESRVSHRTVTHSISSR